MHGDDADDVAIRRLTTGMKPARSAMVCFMLSEESCSCALSACHRRVVVMMANCVVLMA